MNISFSEWKVPLIQEPNELMRKLKELEIVGRKIVNIKSVGFCYNLREDMIEDYAYNYYEKIGEKRYEELSNYTHIPLDTPFMRHIEIDEPIIFILDNGDRIEIDFSEASSLKIGKNSLPKDIECSVNNPNANINIIFSNCIDKEIRNFEVIMSNKLLDFTGSQGIHEPINQVGYISGFRIYFLDCTYIEFSSWYDYGEVTVFQFGDSKILWKDLKEALN